MGSEENPVVREGLNLLEAMGFDAWRNNAIRVPGRTFNGKKGRGDILGISPKGLFLNVECKKPGGKASLEQLEFIEVVNRRGGYGVVVESTPELAAYLIERMKKLGELN